MWNFQIKGWVLKVQGVDSPFFVAVRSSAVSPAFFWFREKKDP